VEEHVNRANYLTYLQGKGILFLTYIVHIDSPQSMLENGILSRNKAIARGLYNQDRDISRNYYQERRERFFRAKAGGDIHDYVPVYFGTKTPMAYVVCRDNGKENTGFLNLDLDLLLTEGMRFSDKNIASQYCNIYADITHLNQLDWETMAQWNLKMREYDLGIAILIARKLYGIVFRY